MFTYPVVAETFDFLNDANGEHVKPVHAFQALDRATSGPVEEGAVGGGTGMGCNGFKGGIGTSSRVLTSRTGRLHGWRPGAMQLRRRSTDPRSADQIGDYRSRCNVRCCHNRCHGRGPRRSHHARRAVAHGARPSLPTNEGRGSIIVIVATDAPLLPHQLERIARRVGMGLGRLGSWAGNSSGDLFLAFSTANAGAARPDTALRL